MVRNLSTVSARRLILSWIFITSMWYVVYIYLSLNWKQSEDLLTLASTVLERGMTSFSLSQPGQCLLLGHRVGFPGRFRRRCSTSRQRWTSFVSSLKLRKGLTNAEKKRNDQIRFELAWQACAPVSSLPSTQSEIGKLTFFTRASLSSLPGD
jgi:hypothetical protein